MPVYVYETINPGRGTATRRFEIHQSMTAAALTHDPETGRPVRRVIQAGYVNTRRRSASAPANPSGTSCCGVAGCGSH
jgi:predicted nucleic acid-binding Zn ribbon protein